MESNNRGLQTELLPNLSDVADRLAALHKAIPDGAIPSSANKTLGTPRPENVKIPESIPETTLIRKILQDNSADFNRHVENKEINIIALQPVATLMPLLRKETLTDQEKKVAEPLATNLLDSRVFREILGQNLKDGMPPEVQQVLIVQLVSAAYLASCLVGGNGLAEAQKVMDMGMTDAMRRDVERSWEVIRDEADRASHLQLPPNVRNAVDEAKFLILRDGAKDIRLQPLIDVLNQKNPTFSREDTLEVRQLIVNITADSNQKEARKFSPRDLQETAADLSRAESVDIDELFQKKEIQHMALYELALDAKQKIAVSAAKQQGFTESQKALKLANELFDDSVGKDLMEGVGFELLNTERGEFLRIPPTLKNFKYDDAGNIGKRLATPEGIFSYYLKYGGILVTMANLIVFLSNRNIKSLGIAAVGAGAVYAGVKSIEKNTINTMLHPENRLYNKVGTLVHSDQEGEEGDRHIFYMLAEYEHFFELFNLNEKNAEFENIRKGTKPQVKGEVSNLNSDRKGTGADDLTGEEKKRVRTEMIEQSFTLDNLLGKPQDANKSEGAVPALSADFGSLLRLGAKERLQTMKSTPFDKYSPKEIFETVKWMYHEDIRNQDLHELALISKNLKTLYPITPLARSLTDKK